MVWREGITGKTVGFHRLFVIPTTPGLAHFWYGESCWKNTEKKKELARHSLNMSVGAETLRSCCIQKFYETIYIYTVCNRDMNLCVFSTGFLSTCPWNSPSEKFDNPTWMGVQATVEARILVSTIGGIHQCARHHSPRLLGWLYFYPRLSPISHLCTAPLHILGLPSGKLT